MVLLVFEISILMNMRNGIYMYDEKYGISHIGNENLN